MQFNGRSNTVTTVTTMKVKLSILSKVSDYNII